jgi:hypothetical protein
MSPAARPRSGGCRASPSHGGVDTAGGVPVDGLLLLEALIVEGRLVSRHFLAGRGSERGVIEEHEGRPGLRASSWGSGVDFVSSFANRSTGADRLIPGVLLVEARSHFGWPDVSVEESGWSGRIWRSLGQGVPPGPGRQEESEVANSTHAPLVSAGLAIHWHPRVVEHELVRRSFGRRWGSDR